MTNVLSRRAALGGLTSRLNSQQLQMDAFTEDLSQQSSSGILALAGASLFGRLVGVGMAGMGMRAGFSPLLTRGAYHASSLLAEVGTYRTLTQGFPHAFEREAFVSDLLTFGILRTAGILGEGRNPIAVHALQSGGAVLAQNLAYRAGWIKEAPQGTILQQLIHSEFFNLKQNVSMGLMHWATGGRVLQIEKLQEAQLEAMFPLSAESNRSFVQENLFVMGSQKPQQRLADLVAEKIIKTGRAGNRGETFIFVNPIASLSRPRDFSPYTPAEEFEIARDGEMKLMARISQRENSFDGMRYTLNYYLNGAYVGYLTHQVIPETTTLRLIDMKISSAMQGQNLGKVIMLYHLYQAHVAGWQFMRDLITNPKLIQTANRPFQDGLNMYLPDARVWVLAMTMDPYEPEMQVREPAHVLYETDTSTWTPNAYMAYRITGTPNPALFAGREQ